MRPGTSADRAPVPVRHVHGRARLYARGGKRRANVAHFPPPDLHDKRAQVRALAEVVEQRACHDVDRRVGSHVHRHRVPQRLELRPDGDAVAAGLADGEHQSARRTQLRDERTNGSRGRHHLPPAGGSEARNIATCWSNMYDDAVTAVAPSRGATATTTSSPPSPRKDTW